MSTLRISLRAGERIFVNGAVMKVDRKTTLEFLNDVTFLLESHVMQAEDAKTPLRQIYFVVQMMLMDPANLDEPKTLFGESLARMLKTYSNGDILNGLLEIEEMVERGRAFEALKRLRTLIPLEDEILGQPETGVVRPVSQRAMPTEQPKLRLAAGGMS
ncbi:flagellum biosynthesis repressor [Fulvimarina pelagi HTCC2506]|uniref:Probable flagellum biosynthesis repressor protein FlbT n=2 Tax=Fulvimarina pelagi TaxID=217511 RepID=Q0G1E2_9HYPH|nr:flagellar biosynthesis repressor FlbT [Fulvimarina pelagi]EAU41139.1 flagellum biosynthesis repressor [Fulvimarina pelagi HTCC2506]